MTLPESPPGQTRSAGQRSIQPSNHLSRSLTGRFKQTSDIEPGDRRHDHPRVHQENFTRNLAIVRRLEPIAAARRCTLAQVALAWVLSRGTSLVPIFGAKHVNYVEENLGALAVRLTDEDLTRLDEAAPKGVPLSHANLICNPDAATALANFERRLEIVATLSRLPQARVTKWLLAYTGLSAAWAARNKER